MIILGDVSGIQNYLFDVSEVGGGQARRLRARSFLVQALAEFAAIRMLSDLNASLSSDRYLFSGAGKFILRFSADAAEVFKIAQSLNEQLLNETSGELRLSVGTGHGGSDVEDFRKAQSQLQLAKANPHRPSVEWKPSKLILAPLDTPCVLCRRSKGNVTELDPDTKTNRLVCGQCAGNYALGKALPGARAMVIRNGGKSEVSWFGLSGTLVIDSPSIAETETQAIITFGSGVPKPVGFPLDRIIARRLMTTVPTDASYTPLEFVDLAQSASGDKLLAVLKADVDSLGVRIEDLLQGRTELTEFLQFADAIDNFFAVRLRDEINRDAQWNNKIYTVFAGGDDLVMIGPWDVMFRFAGCVRQLFHTEFPNLTLSAGISTFKPKRPVKTAIEDAELLLVAAKRETKDQCAALGQVWKWNQHEIILALAERLCDWVNDGRMQRGWLHTLLELTTARHGENPDPLATARLAYHVNRNYRDRDVRDWGGNLISVFDDSTNPKVQFLPAILRYALTATRTAGEKE